MKTSPRSNLTPWLLAAAITAILPAAVLMLSAQTSHAASATWNLNPGSGDFGDSLNWTPTTIPNGSGDTATFGLSNRIGVSVSAFTEANGIVFSAGASAFTITDVPGNLLLSGVGITNNSGTTQNFVTAVDDVSNSSGRVYFGNTATVGSLVAFTNNGSGVTNLDGGSTYFIDASSAGNGTFTNKSNTLNNGRTGGATYFFGTSTAGHGTFTNNGGMVSGINGGQTFFRNTSTAGDGIFTNDGGAVSGAYPGLVSFSETSAGANGVFLNNGSAVSGAVGGATIFSNGTTAGHGTFTNNGGAVSGAGGGATMFFLNTSTAGNGTFTNNGGTVAGADGGKVILRNSSTAGSATLIANGGLGESEAGFIRFEEDATGGTATVKVFGQGNLDIQSHNLPGVTIGSLEGDGDVLLGSNNLTVGSNNLSTIFSGVLAGFPSSLTKIGSGTLRLTGDNNNFFGSTIVSAGRLLANNATGSGTGSSAVTVNNNGSVLGGTGSIGGPVIVNSGTAILGGNATTASGSLTLTNNLTLNSGSTIQLVLGASGAHSSLTRAGGSWTFAPDQKFTFLDVGVQPGVYDNIITGLTTNPGGTASWTITNAGFAGTFAYDGAGNIDLNITSALGPALQLTSAASRKTHGGVGDFDIPLPLFGEPGVECRNSGGNHTLLFATSNNLVNGNASVTTGTGSVSESPSFAGNTMTVNLTGVTDVQKITVTLSNVTDGFAQVLPDTPVSAGFLIGDTNGDRVINAGDTTQTRARSGQTAMATNFRSDVNRDGTINAGDQTAVRARSGNFLP